MKYKSKKIIIILLLLTVLLGSITCISAADNTTTTTNNNIVSVNDTTTNFSVNNNTFYLDSTNTSYTNLSDAYNAATDNDNIIIGAGTYTGNGNIGLNLSKNLTISADMNKTVIFDATNSATSILTITNYTTVTLTGLTFINVNNTESFHGTGAIMNMGNLNVNYCTFANNTAITGGAIENYYGNVNVNKSNFENNSASHGGAISNYNGYLSVTLSNFYKNNATESYGGAIRNLGNLTVDYTYFTDNYAKVNGGAISNSYNSNAFIIGAFTNNNAENSGGAVNNVGNLFIDDSLFNNNRAIGFLGGAIRNNGTLIVLDSSFWDNSAIYGGAIDNTIGDARIEDSIFINNTAYHGGAVTNYANGTLKVIGSNFTLNNANDDFGGAIRNNGTCSVDNSTFTNNTAKINGGAISNSYDSVINVTNSKFINNSASTCGGALNSVCNMAVVNSSFTENFAEEGGAIRSNGTLSVYGSSFSNNYGGFVGGAIRNQGPMTIYDSTFANNTALDGGAIASNSLNNTITIQNSDFLNNTAELGGAISSIYNDLNINNCKFYSNSVYSDMYLVDSNVSGGGAIAQFYGKLSISGSIFMNNTADGNTSLDYAREGGAILSIYALNNITDSGFYYNHAYAAGGAIWTWFGETYLNDNFFLANIGNRNAGAILSQGLLIINDSYFAFNVATDDYMITPVVFGGGAIYQYNGLMELNNSVFINNQAIGNISSSGLGGAIIARNNVTNIYNCEFDQNVASNSGSAIYTNGELNIAESIIANNTAINHSSMIRVANGSLNITNSIITNNKTSYITVNNSKVNYAYDWWGTNDNPANLTHNLGNSTVNLNNWVLAKLTFNNTHVTLGDQIIGKLSLNEYTDGNNTYNMTSDLPEWNYIWTTNDGYNKPTYSTIKNESNLGYVTKASGNFTTTVVIDNQVLTYNFTVEPLTNHTTFIISPDYTFYYNSNLSPFFDINMYYGTITDCNGNVVANHNITLTLTRLTNGASKDYNVTSNYYGQFELPISLAQGSYSVYVTFAGDKDYDASEALSFIYIQGANITANNINVTYGSNITYSGNLTSLNGTSLSNKTVLIVIKRLSDGANKVYNVTTDSNGVFQLPINLSPGTYNVEAINQETYSYVETTILINNGTIDNRTITSISYYPGEINSTSQLAGYLDDGDEGLFNQTVTIELTRLSNGLSKNYTVTTNSNGYYTLPIHLGNGDYAAKVIYPGSSVYQPCMMKGTFTIDKKLTIIY